MPNDDSGILSVVPIALFGSEVRVVTQQALWERLTVIPHGLLCSTASQPPSQRQRGSLQLGVPMKESLVQPVHSVEMHSLVISEAIDFEVTFAFLATSHFCSWRL